MNEHAKVASAPIPFIDLAAQRRRLGRAVDDAVTRVLAHGQYILGPEVRMFEADLAAFCGAKEVVTCANGTDALVLVLKARGIKAGDAVFCPSFTFAATAEVVALVGATPVFVDVFADSFNMDPASLERAIATAKQLGLRPACVISVDLFGQPADYDAIEPVISKHKLWLLDDAAQSFGATYKGRKIGTFGLATSTSFFPAKPLGCYGDGGAVFTDDAELANLLRSIRNHGQGVDRYDNVRIGLNSRLDTIQAAILIEKLKILDDETEQRQEIVRRYNDGLGDVAIVPEVLDGCISTWAQYTIRIGNGRRDAVAEALKAQGIPTAIYYPKPLHQQTAYREYPSAGNGLPVSDAIAKEVLSLPMHPYLATDLQDRIIDAARTAISG
jgi:dTDP-4-amino-4,6-dideoxygalactose transaminase